MRLRHHIHRPKRAGLTLVEMLIALALSIFIMAILSEAFVKGLEVFGQYKALADLEQRLRTVANIVRRDLRAKHFDGDRKLSELTQSGKPMPMLDGLQNAPYSAVNAQILLRQLEQYKFKSPSEGFFSVEEWANRLAAPSNRTTSFFEGQDSSGRNSYRDQYDVLHFSSRLEGNEPDKFFYGKVRTGSPLDGIGNFLSRYDSLASNNLYTSQAAEILMFLGNDDTSFLPGVGTPGGPVQTFNLYRQAWLLIPSQFSNGNSSAGDIYANPALYPIENDVSAANEGNNFFYNTMASVQHRARRIGALPWTVNSMVPPLSSPPNLVPRTPKVQLPALGGGLEGSDILLTNVISFDVKVYDPFAYKIPRYYVPPVPQQIPAPPLLGGFSSGRGAYVDIGDVVNNVTDSTGLVYVNPAPTAAAEPGDALTPVYGNTVNSASIDFFDTGTSRFETDPSLDPVNPPTSLMLGARMTPVHSPATHRYPFTSIQITIRVYEPKSRQTRQITIIQDM